MDKQTHKEPANMDTLAEDARALMAATADVAGEKIAEARTRLAAALQNGKEVYSHARDKAVEKARDVDETVREYPYHTMGIAFGVGMLVGVFVSSQCSRANRE